MAFHWSSHNKGKNTELSGGRVTARRVRDGNYGVVITEEALRPGQRIQLRLDETSESWALGLVSCLWWVTFTMVHHAYGNAGFTIIYFHEFRNASKRSGAFFQFWNKTRNMYGTQMQRQCTLSTRLVIEEHSRELFVREEIVSCTRLQVLQMNKAH